MVFFRTKERKSLKTFTGRLPLGDIEPLKNPIMPPRLKYHADRQELTKDMRGGAPLFRFKPREDRPLHLESSWLDLIMNPIAALFMIVLGPLVWIDSWFGPSERPVREWCWGLIFGAITLCLCMGAHATYLWQKHDMGTYFAKRDASQAALTVSAGQK